MPLTAEERAEINRQNAKKSTGPTSEEGKAASRRNALKHGLRAEALALPGEDPETVAARSEAWNEYYRPESPAAQHLVNACVAATLLSDRCQKYHAAALGKQVRDAGAAWQYAREDQVEALSALLTTDPRAAVLALQRTAHGCRYLIDCWEGLREALATSGDWTGPERDEAIRLQGLSPEPAGLKGSPEAWLNRLFALQCHEYPARAAIDWLFQPTFLPELYKFDYQPDNLPPREECQEFFRELIDARLGPLRDLEAVLRTGYDEPDLAGAADLALILHDGPSARLFLRYHAEARTAFHRAYGSLVDALERDAAVAVEEGPAVAHPNEPEAPPALAAEPQAPADGVPPNEADSDAEATPPGATDRLSGHGPSVSEPAVTVEIRPMTAQPAPNQGQAFDPSRRVA